MLTAPEIDALKPGTKRYDSRGLYAFVTPNGVVSWRWRYRLREPETGKVREREVVLGQWPVMKLTDARSARDKQYELMRDGRDPATEKQRQKRTARAAVIADQDSSFKRVALDWYERSADAWRPGYAANVLSRLETHVFPKLGRVTMPELTPPLILEALRAVEAKGAMEVAHRCKRYISTIGEYAVATGMITSNPARDIGKALRPLKENKHRPAIINPIEFGSLLNAIDGYEGRDVLRLALQILSLTVPRPGELRLSRWENVNLHGATWIIPASDAKQNREHKIALSKPAVVAFRKLQDITGDSKLCFPLSEANDGKPISENALSYALNAIGYAGAVHCPHGFRASFSSIMNETWPNPEIIEKCLAHRDPNEVRRAYARQEHWKERQKLMQAWAQKCEQLKRSAALLG